MKDVYEKLSSISTAYEELDKLHRYYFKFDGSNFDQSEHKIIIENVEKWRNRIEKLKNELS